MKDISEFVERIGMVVDRIDNCVGAFDLPLHQQTHVDALKDILPEISTELKEIFYALGGNKDTWEDV